MVVYMQVSRIPSFTERALLNKTALNLFFTPKCEEQKIKQTSDSIIQTLVNNDRNIFFHTIKDSYWQLATKPIKCIGRTIYVAMVTVIISPLDILWHGFHSIKHLGKYSFAKYTQNNDKCNEEWNKTLRYAQAFFNDFSSFTLGSTFLFFLGGSIAYISTVGITMGIVDITATIGWLVMIGGTMHFLGGFDPAKMIPKLIAEKKVSYGMYIALRLWIELGLTDQDGKLLKFSEKDALRYIISRTGINRQQTRSHYFYTGKNATKLSNLILRAELELLDHIRLINNWLKKQNGATLEYSDPITGSRTAQALQSILNNRKVDQSNSQTIHAVGPCYQEIDVEDVIKNLNANDRKIRIFKEIWQDHRFIIEDSTKFQLFGCRTRQSNRIENATIPNFSYSVKEAYLTHPQRKTS